MHENATEGELAFFDRYLLELAQELDAIHNELTSGCQWRGKSFTDTMRESRR